MPDQTWQTLAREWIEPWEGARDVHGLFVCVVAADGYTERLGETGDRYGRGDCTVDLTHPPPPPEAVARLALFLGAPEDAVEEGVCFYLEDGIGWDLSAGGAAGWAHSDHFIRAIAPQVPADNRPLAIATAWMEARKQKEARNA
jgi:hypothetical protein